MPERKQASMTTTDQTPPLTGRELDAAVAEKVMGWTNFDLGASVHWRRGTPPDWLNRSQRTDIPPYSSSWAAAGLVVEALRKRGCRMKLVENPDGWFCEFYKDGRAAGYWEAASMPEAVARAALAALEAGKG